MLSCTGMGGPCILACRGFPVEPGDQDGLPRAVKESEWTSPAVLSETILSSMDYGWVGG